jgi:HEAT repeat protein
LALLSIVYCLLLLHPVPALQAQPNPPTGQTQADSPAVPAQPSAPAVDAILARIEFNGTETPQTLGPDLARLTKRDLTLLCGSLVEPGTGDDTKARMALHALALHLGRDGTPEQRDTYVDVLCQALESDHANAVDTFLIEQLQLAGNARAAKALSRCLLQDGLRDPAARALLAIGGEAGVAAFLQAARAGTPETRLAILTAIRQSQAPGALRRLAAETNLLEYSDKDQELIVDLLVLAATDDLPAAALRLRELLHADRQGAPGPRPGWWAQTQKLSYAFEVADALLKAGQAELATDVYHYLIETRRLPEEVHVRCAALRGLAAAAGAAAISDVLAALTDEHPEFRAAALEIAVQLGGEGVTQAYIRELEAASPEVRVAILDVLARRRDPSALPVVLAALDDQSPDARIAAIRAAAAIGGEEAVGPLAACLAGDDGDARDVVAAELVALPGEAIASDLAAMLADSPPRMQCGLLNVLSRRRATRELDTIRKYMRHEDPDVRIAAIDAVGHLADDVPTVQRLLLLLEGVESARERETVERALISVCHRPGDNAGHVTTVVDAIDHDDVPEYCSLLRVLGHLGGHAAPRILQAAARDRRADVVEAALRAYGTLPDPDRAIAADVLELAGQATETKPHVLAMRSFTELLTRLETGVPDKLELYRAGLNSSRRVEEQRRLLAGMAEVHDTRTLTVLAPYLEDERLRSETGSAMIMAARGTLPKGWPAAHRALEQVLAAVTEDRVLRHARDVMKEVERFEGYMTDWRVTGPYSVAGKTGHEILDQPFPPEEPGAPNVEWKEQPVNDRWDNFWHIDLLRSVRGDHRAAYLRTYVWSEHEQPARLELGSDDGIKAWLNREVIHTNNALRGCGPAQDKVDIRLRQGWNELLLKVTNDGGGWGASARLRGPEGGALRNVRTDANAEPRALPRPD